MYLEKITINSVDSLLTSDETKIDSWKVGKERDEFDLNWSQDLFQNIVYSTNKEYIINRKYMDIYFALASLGGIANVLITVGFILLRISIFNPQKEIDAFLYSNNSISNFFKKSQRGISITIKNTLTLYN